jgi:hypothetical protein
MQSEKIAAKHIDISLRVKQIAARCIPQYKVYVATYTAGSAGQIYQRLEEKSGAEFWSIKAWTPPSPRRRRLKDPDGGMDQGELVPILFRTGSAKTVPSSEVVPLCARLALPTLRCKQFQNALFYIQCGTLGRY